MKSPEIIGNSILLLGYGRENQSVHRFLTEQYPGLTISIADKNSVTPLSNVQNVYNGKDYLDHLDGYTTVVRTPGIPHTLPELIRYRKNGGNLTCSTNIFFSIAKGITIGITGTKGKSTCSALIAAILKTTYTDVRFVGNIGYPFLDAIKDESPKTIYVIELSSHQLADSHVSPHVAVVLNIVPEHMDYYRSFDEYAAAKAKIISHQAKRDVVIYNPHHTNITPLLEHSLGKKLLYSTKAGPNITTWVDNDTVVTKTNNGDEVIIETSAITIKGNRENIMAAVTVGAQFNIPGVKMRDAIIAFQPLPHRLEFVGEYRGIRFYNDSLATIPEATIHALESLGPDVETLIAGGFDRGLDYTKLGEFLARQNELKTLIFFPDTGEKIWKAVRQAPIARRHPGLDPGSSLQKMDSGSETGMTKLQKFGVITMEEAVRLAYLHTSPGKICLLSPAAASFNLFKDYADRGNQFKQHVQSLQSLP